MMTDWGLKVFDNYRQKVPRKPVLGFRVVVYVGEGAVKCDTLGTVKS